MKTVLFTKNVEIWWKFCSVNFDQYEQQMKNGQLKLSRDFESGVHVRRQKEIRTKTN